MNYEYSGYLKTILDAPDLSVRDTLPCVEFTADDMCRWTLRDLEGDLEWQHIPSSFSRTAEGIALEGRFNDVQQIDNLAKDDPSFWVALGSLNTRDGRFPVEAAQFPIIEITYRCTSPNARPAWLWTYPGGARLDGLAPSQEWRTIARWIQHAGFPAQVDALILRLYSVSRGVESFEVASIRFRALSDREAAACRDQQLRIDASPPPARYPLLDEFLPFGSCMDAASAKRLAAMLGVSSEEYWALAFEDIVRHHHNCIALENIDRLSESEWRDLLALAEPYDIKFFAIHKVAPGSPRAHCEEFVETHVRPYAASRSICAWSLYHKPPEHAFTEVLQAREMLEHADPNHPMAVVMRGPGAVPVFAGTAPILGIEHFNSHVPWEVRDIVRTHLPLLGNGPGGQRQLWMTAPAFVYATDTPEWHSCPEMRLMMNAALANGARGWFTFAYHNDPIWIRGSCQRSLTGPFLTFSDLWSELGQRAEHVCAMAPLLLKAVPQASPESWFVTRCTAHTNAQFPEGVPPTHVSRLCGEDYELYGIVSNDIREMTTVHLEAAPAAIRGRALYDLTDYIRTRRWVPMDPKRHLEMFPGQMHLILIAQPDVCARWRDVILRTMIENDRRYLAFDLALVRSYDLNIGAIDKIVESAGRSAGVDGLEAMQRARDMLNDLIYSSPQICDPRTQIIEASAAVCACDGSLCRLLSRGRTDQAHDFGFHVLPLAREFTNLRLELRRGKGAAILGHCRTLAARGLELLAEIRAVSA